MPLSRKRLKSWQSMPQKAPLKPNADFASFDIGTKQESRIKSEHPELYHRYHAMIQRCTDTNNKDYHNYGGRGIQVCDNWLLSFNAYVEHVTSLPNYDLSLTIDREDNDGDYEPGNVRWATMKVQRHNRRR